MNEDKPDDPKPVDTDQKKRGDRLGRQLRRLYDDVTHENVPDDFLRLLEEADRSRSSNDSGAAS